MSEGAVVRACIDEATAVLASMGLSLSDAFRMPLKRVAPEKAFPFGPLVANAETIAAMKAARRGDVVTVGDLLYLLASLNILDRYHMAVGESLLSVRIGWVRNKRLLAPGQKVFGHV